MAASSTRTLWKGAISFGLVHIPVALHSATEDTRPKMRMLDQQSGAPVGYRKVDKSTGEEVGTSDVVKGIQVDPGEFVTVSTDEIREALPKSTQTIEIEAFVRLQDVPPVFYNKPYYVSPQGRAQKVYALLRDVLRRTGRAGLGRVVVFSKQHLALVFPMGGCIVVNLVRWSEEIRDIGGLPLPGPAEDVGVTERELNMGEQLVLELADEWHPERFRDEFSQKVKELVEAKRKAGEVKRVEMLAPDVMTPASEVVDLTDLLRRSLKSGAAPAQLELSETGAGEPARRRPPKQAANDEMAARAAAKKSPSKARTSVAPRAKKPKE